MGNLLGSPPIRRVKGSNALIAKIMGKNVRIGALSPRGVLALRAIKRIDKVKINSGKRKSKKFKSGSKRKKGLGF